MTHSTAIHLTGNPRVDLAYVNREAEQWSEYIATMQALSNSRLQYVIDGMVNHYGHLLLLQHELNREIDQQERQERVAA